MFETVGLFLVWKLKSGGGGVASLAASNGYTPVLGWQDAEEIM